MFRKPSLKNFADYFVMGLKLNFDLYPEIIIWVDEIIDKTNIPSDWMINLSTSFGKNQQDIIYILNTVPGIQDAEVSFRLLIAKLALIKPIIYLQNNRFITSENSQLFSRLYFLVREYDNLPNDIRENIFKIYMDMDEIDQGYIDHLTLDKDYQTLLTVGKDYQYLVKM
ncbi:MAG: hypothetical protein ACRC80_30460 [Waterburya sp.]